MRRFLGAVLLASLNLACQATMSLEEAKKVTASFVGSSFVPPPRTINDITAILDQQKLANPEAAAKARAQADQPPPKTTDPAILADFYYQRGLAAREIGRAKQEIDDLAKALEWAERAGGRSQTRYDEIAFELAFAEVFSGNFSSAITHLQKAIATIPDDRWGALIRNYAMLARLHASAGDFEAARFNVGQVQEIVAQSGNFRNLQPGVRAIFQAQAADTQARLAEIQGKFAEAEAFYREGIGSLERDPVASKHRLLDFMTAQLARTLAFQGRLLEAENEARKALLSALGRRGRYSTHTAFVLRALIEVIYAQGRYAEAETLARARVDIYQKAGSADESVQLAEARNQLGAALVAQGRWQEALAEREAIERGLRGDPENLKYFSGDVYWALALLSTGQPDQALEILNVALERNRRLLGEKGQATAGVRGLMGMAYTVRGDKPRALKEFSDSIPILLSRSPQAEEESASRPARDQRLNLILASYMSLLADIRGTSLEKEANIDAAAEAFRLADVARGRSVQRALDAGAARAAATTPALADLVRREQDAKKQVSALLGVLANVLSAPTDQQNPKNIASLRTQIETLRRAQGALAEQIEKEFPAYAQLINPAPATLERARASLRPGEAMIATYVGKDRTFVWAIPKSGEVAFAAAPIGEKALGEMVGSLRKALDPNVQVLGDIPEFELGLAHKLYAALLEPVAAGWQEAQSLLVVPHGPLGHLPFAVLPTKLVTLAAEPDALFSKYRAVPWLARTHAVTVLPSVASLGTQRALPSGDPKRRPFVGFGDPYFSKSQAERAARRARTPEATAALSTRGVPITLRNLPKTQGFDSNRLAMLPRLPETGDEIRSIALAMNADLTKEVFIGAQANERAVKSLDLSGYRVIAFATHGLVPGDLDGLTQPALALSSPEVAQVDGDGLLTMEEILGLRLNADWVVLSACNTASGNGTGSEAISGLGRAFFYAGARALLVSNWPVETNSARELTTDLFRRQSVDRKLTRAKALQQTMIAMIDGPGFVDPKTKSAVFSYAHPIFWAPFALVGDGG